MEQPLLLHEVFQPGTGAALVRLFPMCAGTLDGWSGIDRLSALHNALAAAGTITPLITAKTD